MPIDMSKIYAIGASNDAFLLNKFKTAVESDVFQDKVFNLLYDAAQQGSKTGCLILRYTPTSNLGQNGELIVILEGKTLIEIETSTSSVRSSCNNNFMKFAEVLTKLFDENQMRYTVTEISKFTPVFTVAGNSPNINFIIKLRDEE